MHLGFHVDPLTLRAGLSLTLLPVFGLPASVYQEWGLQACGTVPGSIITILAEMVPESHTLAPVCFLPCYFKYGHNVVSPTLTLYTETKFILMKCHHEIYIPRSTQGH